MEVLFIRYMTESGSILKEEFEYTNVALKLPEGTTHIMIKLFREVE